MVAPSSTVLLLKVRSLRVIEHRGPFGLVAASTQEVSPSSPHRSTYLTSSHGLPRVPQLLNLHACCAVDDELVEALVSGVRPALWA